MQEIALFTRHGEEVARTLVDDEDFPWLNQDTWRLSARGYVTRGERRSGRYVRIYMHREILGLTDPRTEGDHRDLDKLNNQRSNLRPLAKGLNQQNRPSQAGTSRFRGVMLNRDPRYSAAKRWIASAGGVRLGYFATEEEAADVARRYRLRTMPGSLEDRAVAGAP